MRHKWIILAALLPLGLLAAALSVDGVVTTVVGASGGDGVPALNNPLGLAQGLAVDAVGNIYYCEPYRHRVRRIDAGTGIVTTIAGTGEPGYFGDGGLATDARLYYPKGLWYLSWNGVEMLYIADAGNQRIRRIDMTQGTIASIAGNGISGFSGDNGPPTLASVNLPATYGAVQCVYGYATTSDLVRFSDSNNNRFRSFTVGSGAISTITGNGSTAYAPGQEGALATAAGINQPAGIVAPFSYDPGVAYYVADSGNFRIRRVNLSNQIQTVVGNGVQGYSGDGGAGTSAMIGKVAGLALDSLGGLYFADQDAFRIRRYNPATGKVSTVAGAGQGNSGDGGLATAAHFGTPQSPAVTGNGDLYFIDADNYLIKKVDHASGIISTVAGVPGIAAGSGAATQIALAYPGGVGLLPDKSLVLFNAGSNRVLRYDPGTGQVSTFAGNGTGGAYGSWGENVPATTAQMGTNGGILTTDDQGNVYLMADDPDYCIRKIDVGGNIHTIVGQGSQGPDYSTGLASSSLIGAPYGMAARGGILYFSDGNAGSVMKVSMAANTVVTYIGAGGAGFMDGPVASAQINGPTALAIGSDGALYIADMGNNAVRKVDPAGLSLTTVCGLGPTQFGYRGDGGPATNAALNQPRGLWIDGQDNLFIADTGNNRIRRIDHATGIIDTAFGNGYAGFTLDGLLARQSRINQPSFGVSLPSGDFYVTDWANSRIRLISYAQSPTPTPVNSSTTKAVAYPSPADQRICFSYQAPKAGPVQVEVYNVAMQLVAKMDDSAAGPGAALTCGDVHALANGIYLYRVSVAGTTLPANKFRVNHK
jgi:hypothetical protein